MSALQERRARLLDSLYRAYGEAANWAPAAGGDAVPLTVRRRTGEDVVNFGDSQTVLSSGELRVRKAEQPAPQRGDVVTLLETGEVFRVGLDPYLTPTGLEWVISPVPVP